MGIAPFKSRRALSGLLAALLGPLTVSVLCVVAPTAAHADTAPAATPVGGTVAGGYVLGASDGGVYNFGSHDFGSMGGKPLAKPIVGMASTPTGDGYWMVASDGGIFSFGDAAFHGSTGNIALNKPIVGMASTPTGQGYWFVAEDGGIFAFGDAAFYGSTGNITLNKPIVGMAATPSGGGYWFVASDGGIFSFGDAAFYGSTGNITLVKPIVGMAATPAGAGYWMVASDGGIFSFGDAGFYGSTGAIKLAKPIVDMAATPTGEGYWLVADDGGVFTFGNAAYKGSTGAMKLNGQIVDLLPQGGDITAPVLQSLVISPSQVDTSTGPATVTVTARVTDDVSGVYANTPDGLIPGADNLYITFRSGSQQAGAGFGTRISGDAHDGVYQATVTLPQYSAQGTWTIDPLRLNDRAGNLQWVQAPTLAAAGYPTTIQQLGAGDQTPPKVQSLVISPSQVDTSTGPATVTVTARVTDDVSGVYANTPDGLIPGADNLYITFRSGSQQAGAGFGTRISGDAHDGVYQATVTLPQYSAQGTWTIDPLRLNDRAGNLQWVQAPTLAAAGYPTTIQQLGAGDQTPPKVQSLVISPSQVDTSTGPATVTVTARVTDDVSGVYANTPDGLIPGADNLYITFRSGSQQAGAGFGTRISGDAHDGVYQATVTLPQYSAQGTWTIDPLRLNDRAGNLQWVQAPALAAAGYPTTFEVVRTG